MDIERLLGKYNQEEQELLRKIKKSNPNQTHSSESRGGMMGVGKKMVKELNFLPSVEEVDTYLEYRRRSLFHNGR